MMARLISMEICYLRSTSSSLRCTATKMDKTEMTDRIIRAIETDDIIGHPAEDFYHRGSRIK